jgi:hypothetical protein
MGLRPLPFAEATVLWVWVLDPLGCDPHLPPLPWYTPACQQYGVRWHRPAKYFPSKLLKSYSSRNGLDGVGGILKRNC